MTKLRQRTWYLIILSCIVSGAVMVTLGALNNNLLFFVTPTDIYNHKVIFKQKIRLGGIVVPNSVTKKMNNLTFEITDGTHTTPVSFKGIVPDLFKEGQGVIAEGELANSGIFQATQILAKHDENYMPPEVAKVLKESGNWPPKTFTSYKK
jgi:cytochrome c-type biogenesis protein CcmE